MPISILAWYGLRWWVFALYIAAALTDLLDGMFARRAAPPASDIDFDGLADLLLSVMTLFWFWLLIPAFLPKYWLPYLPILVLLEIYTISVRIRFREIHVPHLQLGRMAMALFFVLLPVLIVWGDVPWFVHLVFVMGTAAKLQLAWNLVGQVKAVRKNTLVE